MKRIELLKEHWNQNGLNQSNVCCQVEPASVDPSFFCFFFVLLDPAALLELSLPYFFYDLFAFFSSVFYKIETISVFEASFTPCSVETPSSSLSFSGFSSTEDFRIVATTGVLTITEWSAALLDFLRDFDSLSAAFCVFDFDAFFSYDLMTGASRSSSSGPRVSFSDLATSSSFSSSPSAISWSPCSFSSSSSSSSRLSSPE